MATGKPKVKPNRGGHLLKAWLDLHEQTQTDFARSVICTKSYIGLLLDALATPGLHLAVRIEKATDGFIPPRAWYEPPPRARPSA